VPLNRRLRTNKVRIVPIGVRPALRRIGGAIGVGIVAVGSVAGATLAVLHPSAARAAIAAATAALTCAATSACESGSNTSTGPGLSATSAKGTAITASGVSGVSATGTSGYGVQGTSTSVPGVYGRSTQREGVLGISMSGLGVRGTSQADFGVYGNSEITSGVAGTTGSASPTAAGIYGVAQNGYGVRGDALGNQGAATGVYGNAALCCYGVVGTSGGGGIGVFGEADSGWGVRGASNSGTGVSAYSNSGSGLDAASISGVALSVSSESNAAIEADTGGAVAIYGKALQPGGNGAEISGANIGLVGRSNNIPLWLSTLNGNVVFFVDGSGNVHYNGGLMGFSRMAGGGTVSAYSTKVTQPTVEDTGSSQLISGVAAVKLDPAFAASIDPAGGYRVFLTPVGETHGWLFVATKTANGFLVREAQGGRSTVPFDYRSVATALGEAGARMAVTAGALPPGTPAEPVNSPPAKHHRPLPPLPASPQPATPPVKP